MGSVGVAFVASATPWVSVVAALVAGALLLLTESGRRVGGQALAFFVGRVLRVRRRHVEAALAGANIGSTGDVADGMYGCLGEHLLEVLSLTVSDRALGRVELPGGELEALIGRGRGALIAAAHTGNWDLTACALAARAPLTVVTKHLSVRSLDVVWQRLRRRYGVRLVAEGQAWQEARRALSRGHLVAMMVDQVPMRERGVVWAPFLGAPAPVDLAPALVAMKARVPLVAAFGFRAPDGTHRVTVRGVIQPPATASRAWAEESMRQVTAWLDAFVREHPEQWLWMHRRWTSHAERRPPRRAGLPAPGEGGIRTS